MAEIPKLIHDEISKFRSRTQGSVDGTIVAKQIENGQAIVVYVDSGAAQLFGFPSQELEGYKLSEIVPLDARRLHIEYEEKFFAEAPGTERGMRNLRVVRGLRKDGSEYQVQVGLARYDAENTKFAIAYLKNCAPQSPSWMASLISGMRAERRQEIVGLKLFFVTIALASVVLTIVLAGFLGYFFERETHFPSPQETPAID